MPIMAGAGIASLLASLGGTLATMSAQSAIKHKQKAVQAAEAARQADINRRRDAAMNNAIPQYTPQAQDQKQQSLADQLTQYLTPTANTQTDYLADSSTPQEIRDSMSRQLAGSLQKGKDYAKNMAQVSALNRLNLDNGFDMNRLGQNIGMLNSEATRSANILPIELEGANRAGVTGNTVAAGLNGFSSIANAVLGAGLMSNPLGGAGGAGGALPKGSPLPLNAMIA